jgi:hypothetical protein
MTGWTGWKQTPGLIRVAETKQPSFELPKRALPLPKQPSFMIGGDWNMFYDFP